MLKLVGIARVNGCDHIGDNLPRRKIIEGTNETVITVYVKKLKWTKYDCLHVELSKNCMSRRNGLVLRIPPLRTAVIRVILQTDRFTITTR